jgi:hypothetical protein
MALPASPPEFRKACRNFGPDIEEFVSSIDEMVGFFLNGIDQKEAVVVRSFLKDPLSADLSPEELKEFWWSTPATTVFHDGGDVLAFLRRVHEVLATAPYGSGESTAAGR